MKKTMKLFAAVSAALCAVFAAVYLLWQAGWAEACAITFGTIAYHFAIRLIVAWALGKVSRKMRYDHNSFWFRQKRWEPPLYRLLGVKKWKRFMPTAEPGSFDLRSLTPQQVVANMCHAEMVHVLIVPFSLGSILFAIPFGELPVFLITALIATLFDCSFIAMQRYNRPRVARLIRPQSTI